MKSKTIGRQVGKSVPTVRPTKDSRKLSKPKSLVGLSNAIAELNNRVPEMAAFVSNEDTMNSILVTGHSGVGKTVLIDLILHECKRRHGKESMVFDCSAAEPNLIRSELFGHLEGAFTGAIKERIGLLKEAEKRILFLDEIGNVSSDIQKALLLAIEGRQIIPVGGNFAKDGYRANFGLITATMKDVRHSDDFAKELYYRISLWPVEIPPLSERKIDIISLICDILRKHHIDTSKRTGHCWSLANLYALMEYDWRIGGYRELEQEVLHLTRTGNLSWQFQQQFHNEHYEDLLTLKGTPIDKFISRNGEPENRKYRSRNMVELRFSRGGGRRIYDVTFQEDKLENSVLSRYFTYLEWPDQKDRVHSPGLHNYLKSSEIYIHPKRLQELIILESQYYEDNYPTEIKDPRESFNTDLFFLGLICPYQDFRPSKYIPYTSQVFEKEKTDDVAISEKQVKRFYKFPCTSVKPRLVQADNYPKIIIEETEAKTMNGILLKYGYASLSDDLKRLVFRQKTVNKLTWPEVERIHGLDSRAIRTLAKKDPSKRSS